MKSISARSEVTEWLPCEVSPVRPGLYQLLNTSTDMLFYSQWNGEAWCIGCREAELAATFTRPSVVQFKWPWRGLKEPA
jgi:hypothetical protein